MDGSALADRQEMCWVEKRNSFPLVSAEAAAYVEAVVPQVAVVAAAVVAGLNCPPGAVEWYRTPLAGL